MDARTLRAGLDVARRAGARAAELHLETSEVTGVDSLRGRVTVLDGERRSRLVVGVWLDGGRAARIEGAPEALAELVSAAVRQAAEAPEDPHAAPVARQTGVLGGLGVLDRRLDQLAPEDRAEVVTGAERELRAADRRLQSLGFTYREHRVVRRYASTRGVLLEEPSSVFEVTGRASVPADGGELVLERSVASRLFATVASFPFGADLARRAGDLLRPRVELSGPVRVVLPALAVGHLFGWLATLFAPGARDTSFLRDRRLDPRVHLQDDGTLPGGLRTGSFDERGVAPVPLVLVREGHPEGLYLDPEAARRRGAAPTGHTSGGVHRPSNLLLRAGTRSVSAALSDLGGRVLVLDDLEPSAADPGSGDLATTVHGAVLEGGRPVGSARGLRLTGSLGEVLSRVVEVCGDTDRVGHVDAAAMIVDGLHAG